MAAPAPSPTSAGGSRTPILYIMGHGYSGSTLLTLLLDRPPVATVGELGIAPLAKAETTAEEYLCSCGAPIRECSFWRQVSAAMAARGFPFDPWDSDLDLRARGTVADVLLRALLRGPGLELARRAGLALLPTARRQLAAKLRRIEALVAVTTELRGARVFVDASKRPERGVFMRRIRSFDVHVLHLVRDGRAVACSSMRNLGWSPRVAADWWVDDNRRTERARRYFRAERWMRLRYEDLCADPARALARIHGFVGLPEPLSAAGDRVHHVIGNRMRLGAIDSVRADDRWRGALSATDLAVIEARVGAMNRRYGYGAGS